MAMHAISVKELRQKFPFVQSELKKGESFLLICKSKPIGILIPINGNGGAQKTDAEEKNFFAAWENAGAEEWLKLPPITKEEDDYYMSLSPLKD